MINITDNYPVFYINRQIAANESEIYIDRRLYDETNQQKIMGIL